MRAEETRRSWRDPRSVTLLGMGTALPGPPVSTAELLERLHSRFEIDVRRQGMVLAARLGVRTRHICRDFTRRHEAPRGGDSNGVGLFADGLMALRQLGVDCCSVDYFIPHRANGHMARLLAAQIDLNEARIFVNADRVGNTGSAAIWMALAELRTRLHAGDSVCVLGAEATKYLFGGFKYVHA